MLLKDSPLKFGVLAMDAKANSKPMKAILKRLQMSCLCSIEFVEFGDEMINHQDVKYWPVCDVLVAFYSSGFPMNKALDYVELHRPILVNDLCLQQILWDRRLISTVLNAIGVRTPRFVTVSRDGGPKSSLSLSQPLQFNIGLARSSLYRPSPIIISKDFSTLSTDSTTIRKPYVEKPVDADDHNVNIYFSDHTGGGCTQLFRKIGDKSSEYFPDLTAPRLRGSYIYEEYMSSEDAVDIKVYTIGPSYAYAESRKSPLVDGVVERDDNGKERRMKIDLTAEEQNFASEIVKAFGQNICGFDMIRSNGKSYVIDVNGWSFVKGNDEYYQRCAEYLGGFCERARASRNATGAPLLIPLDDASRQDCCVDLIDRMEGPSGTNERAITFISPTDTLALAEAVQLKLTGSEVGFPSLMVKWLSAFFYLPTCAVFFLSGVARSL